MGWQKGKALSFLLWIGHSWEHVSSYRNHQEQAVAGGAVARLKADLEIIEQGTRF